jgi:hypothetical protein
LERVDGDGNVFNPSWLMHRFLIKTIRGAVVQRPV